MLQKPGVGINIAPYILPITSDKAVSTFLCYYDANVKSFPALFV